MQKKYILRAPRAPEIRSHVVAANWTEYPLVRPRPWA